MKIELGFQWRGVSHSGFREVGFTVGDGSVAYSSVIGV